MARTTGGNNKPRKKKTPKPAHEKLKPGSKGKFFGTRYQFLSSRLNEYYDAADRGATRPFFKKTLARYWDMFPWQLARNEEPEEGVGYPTTDDEAFARKKTVIQAENKVRDL